MWSGPVGLGAMRTRSVVIRSLYERVRVYLLGSSCWAGAVGPKPGPSPSRSAAGGLRDPMEQSRIRVACEDADQCGWAKAECCPATRSFERQGPRLEIGQEAGILLGLFGDPIDGRALTGLGLAERRARRAPASRIGIDR